MDKKKRGRRMPNIVLGVSGSVAAIKTREIVDLLAEFANVQVSGDVPVGFFATMNLGFHGKITEMKDNLFVKYLDGGVYSREFTGEEHWFIIRMGGKEGRNV